MKKQIEFRNEISTIYNSYWDLEHKLTLFGQGERDKNLNEIGLWKYFTVSISPKLRILVYHIR